MFHRLFSLLVVGLFAVQCSHTGPQFQGQTEGERLQAFFEWSFMSFLERQPQEMTYLGVDKRQGELDSHSEAFAQETLDLSKQHLKILQSFSRRKLNAEDQLSYDLYQRELKQKIEDHGWRYYHYPVNQMFGIHSGLPSFMINIHRVSGEQDLQNYISRLREFQRVFSEVTNSMMRSETLGVVPPKFVFAKVIDDCKNVISGNPFVNSKNDSPLWSDFKKKMKNLKLSKAQEKQFLEQARQALLQSVGPGYADLIAFLEGQEERSSTDAGVWKFPRGKDFYEYRLRKMTTMKWSADEIHQIGLDNVERIHSEMKAVASKVKFKGDLPAFFAFMQSDRFLFKNTKAGKQKYLNKAKFYIDNMRKQLDKLFITKPKADIVVKAVEPFREKSAGMAFYQVASPDGARPGIYYVNLSNMKAVPTWEAEALAYHEGIPGHHMQLSIAQELTQLPKFRRHSHYTSYIEGWGLYSERMPKEIGFYQDPYSDFGRLSMELTRATRLVVDTGLHHKKWTREQAIDYLNKTLPGEPIDHSKQIERYIVMPGQATAYTLGMLQILQLRERAKKQMGKKFDLREFHDVVLTNGPVPMDVLSQRVEAMIQAQ